MALKAVHDLIRLRVGMTQSKGQVTMSSGSWPNGCGSLGISSFVPWPAHSGGELLAAIFPDRDGRLTHSRLLFGWKCLRDSWSHLQRPTSEQSLWWSRSGTSGSLEGSSYWRTRPFCLPNLVLLYTISLSKHLFFGPEQSYHRVHKAP